MSDLEVNLKTHSPKLNPKMNTEMYVYKRDGRKEPVHFEKVQNRIKNKSFGLNVNPTLIAQKVCSRIYDGVKTSELDELACQLCASLSTEHPDYGILANRIVISNNHKTTPSTFKEAILKLYDNQDTNGNHAPLISEEVKTLVLEKGDIIEKEIDYQRDYFYDYFGFKTLQRGYLLKSKGHVVERIQHLIMRVSLGLHGRNLKSAFQSYHLMSQKFFTHATPTLFHAGTPRSQCLSCFLIGTDDSVNGMYKTVGDCAQISKWAGGIGVHVSNIRSKGSYIRGSNGESSGLIPLLRVYNATARHIDQAGKRKGSIAIYLETHHPDIFDFLDIRKNNGNEEARARDLFTALWVSDLFMKKVEYALKHPNETIEWCLFDPDECPGLTEAYGDEFEKLYEKYEKEGRERQKIDITKLWKKILSSQIETGTPYILYKDQINKHCNQKNIGTIKSSNLCAEITEFSNKDEYACCCLSSISLSSLVEIPKIEGKVKIYTKTDCPYCEMACELLGDYEKIVLDDDEERKVFYNDLSGVKCEDGVCKMEKPKTVNGKRINTVPQIFINDKHVGGYTELKTYLKPKFNFEKLEEICYVLVKNLNRVIDINFYPVPETARGNFKHRPLGIGVQGLADTLMKMRIPFESDEAKELNKKIFESIQYYCLKGSMELSRERQEIMESNHFRSFRQHIFYEIDLLKHHTKRKLEELEDLDLSRWEYHGEYFTLRELLSDKSYYSTFEGSPLSQGIFQFESMGIEVEETFLKTKWNELRRNILKYGIRNSLLTALMPTASTSQILGNNECFEPITSNIYSRRTLAGDFVIVNQYLVNDLIERGIWSKEVKDMVIANNGSIQNMSFMTRQEKELYKTVWEIKQKALIDLSADRTPFICQTQSLNLFFEEPKNNSLGSALLYGWKRGLKTGSYYIRSRPKIQAQQFTIDPKLMNQVCESCSG